MSNGLKTTFHLIVILSVWFQSAHGGSDNQPKLMGLQGDFTLQAAQDKNITIRLNGVNSAFMINDFNVLESLQKKSVKNPQRFEREIAVLPFKVRRLIRAQQRLGQRIRMLENSSNPAQMELLEKLEAESMSLLQRLVRIDVDMLDRCASSPCKNGADCYGLFADFHCDCPDSWTGKTCETDVDECETLKGTDLGCQNNATCVNLSGSYRCVCAIGFSGPHCRERKSDCEKSAPGELCGKGTCIPTNNDVGYKCICDAGWKTDGIREYCSVDVNECVEAHVMCHTSCINLPGSFACGPCPRGYTGDGIKCQDIDECAVNNGGCSTRPKVQCINTEGSHQCGKCPPGWTGNGQVCSQAETNSCEPNDICHPQALCQYVSNIMVCQCPAGMTGTGYGPAGCTIISSDRCADHQCKNGGICIRRGMTQSCLCPPGYKKPFCESQSACAQRPCFNGGMCVDDDSPGGFHCVCSRGSSGPLCQHRQLSCGSVIRDRSGELTYPSNGGPYEPNKACAWGIRTDYNFILNVTFSRFELEAHPECGKDWLQINDGRSLATPLIGRFCGNKLPNDGNILSSHNTLFLWFRSDNTTNLSGFSLTWNSILPICGGHQQLDKQAQGVIRSPGYPGKSPRRRNCEWIFEAPFGNRILFRFYEVIMDNAANCTRDKLIIYDSMQPLEYVCETGTPAPIYTSSNVAKILFYSDDNLEDTLFQVHYEVVPASPGCGGVHSESKGTFQLTSDMKNCNFLIQQPPGTKVSVSFTKGERLYGSPTIKIFDGKTDDDPILTESEDGNLPEKLLSSQNFMLIVMSMLPSPMDQARSLVYEVSYSLVCGEEFRGKSNGTFMTPNYPKPYFTGLHCTYTIIAPMDWVVHLNITDYDISEYEDSCNDDTDFVEIYYDVNKPGERHCKDVPMYIVSRKNHLRIDFHSNANPQRRRGIAGNYWFEWVQCGGVLREPEGSVVTFAYPTECEWILEAPPTYVISLNLHYSRLNPIFTSGEDDVQIFLNYTDSDARLVQSLCCGRKEVTTVLYSNLATIFLKPSIGPGGLFSSLMRFNYTFIKRPSTCGGNLTDLSGNIQSPGFPSKYLDSTDCIWVIHAPLGHKIELVPKMFSLEPSSRQCNSDYLEIRNGMSEQSPLIGKFCGETILPHIPSFTNHLYLHFHSDSTVAAAGFDILYQQTSSGCGGSLNSHSGSIASPHYPEIPSGAVQCDWKITVNRGSVVDLHIAWLSPRVDFCTSNVVRIYDGVDSLSKQLLTNCSQSDTTIFLTSSGNTIFVRYALPENTSADGQQFYLNYTTNCRQTLTSMEGVIESPNFPSDYPSYLRCEWTILGRQTDKIVLTFSHFDLEKDDLTCAHDVFEVLDMKGEEVLQKKKICNAMETEDVLTSDGNQFVVRFSSDYSHTATGFRLEFKRSGCGGYETWPRGVLVTPNAPYSYDMDCEWLIETSPGMLITLQISDMAMATQNRDCATNGLIVKNNKDDKINLLEECQTEATRMSVTSQGTTMYIRFVSDSRRSRKFFRAFYSTKAAQCGGIFRSNWGTIMSPNYPNNYSENSYCEWMISTENAFLLKLEFITMDIPVAENCSKGFIEVYDGRKYEKNSKLIQRFCESKNEFFLASTGSMVDVILNSNGGPPAKGFLMKFRKQCGFNLEKSSGLLKSYIQDQPCFWTYFPNDTESKLTITVLKLECHCEGLDAEACKSRGLTIYKDGNKMQQFCESAPTELTLTGQILIAVRDAVSIIAKYSIDDASCGGELSSLRGSITSPYYPSVYPMNTECIWIIKASPGNNIELSFDEMNLDQTDRCNKDYVEVRENTPNGKLLGAFCSNDSLSQSFIVYEKIWIKFHSGDTSFGVNSGGFKLSWTYAQLTELNGFSGRIQPPTIALLRFEPEPFRWRIIVPRDNVIWLAFTEYNGGLELYDGFDENALAIDIQMSPFEVTSSSNVILLKTDNKILEHFQLDWKAQSKNAIKENKTVSNCNETFNIGPSTSVELSSPGYPGGYEDNLKCEWVVKADRPTRHAVVALFEVQLETLIDCIADYLQIFTSHNLIDWHEELKICDSPPKNRTAFKVISGTPYLKLKLTTDASVNKTGFRSTLHTFCGGNLTDSVGRIQGSELYENFRESCTWHIQVRQGRKIKFTFEFPPNNVVNSSDQCSSYAILRDGMNDDGVILQPGRICPLKQFNGTVLSNTNRATLKFHAVPFRKSIFGFDVDKWNVTYREFIACGGEVRLTPYSRSVNFTSPNYPHVPNPHTECVWLIVAPPGETVRAEFVDQFSMNTRQCNKEFVEFRDGSTALARNLGKHCRRPATIRSSGNVLYMRYLTDIAEPRNGFKVNVSISTCGGTFTQFNNIITSSNYPAPGGYPANSVCDYVIKVSTFSRLNLTFTDVHLPFDSANLNASDRIVIYQLLDSTSEEQGDELAVIYGNTTRPPVLLVHSNVVLIRFHTFKANNVYRGFKLNYDRLYGFCFRDISGESGLLSLSLPLNRRVFELCRWKITVPKGRLVKADILNIVPATPGVARDFNIKFFNDFQLLSLIAYADFNNITALSSIRSTDNMMYIVIHGLNPNSLRSMRMAYSSNELSNCTDDISMDIGSLSLANVDHSQNFFCKSDIVLNGKETLSINITSLEVELLKVPMQLKCVWFQSRSVMDSRYMLCANSTNKIVLIPVKRGSINIYQNQNVRLRKFEATYVKHQCGGEYYLGFQLKLTLPRFESTYGRLDCGWVIFAGLNTNFELTGSFTFKHPCEDEYIVVYAGTNANSLAIAKYCENGTFNTTQLTSTYVYIEYRTPAYNPESLMDLTVRQVNRCGGKRTVRRLESIQLNKVDYKDNLECVWDLQAEEGFFLRLEFTGRFFIEDSTNCTKDYLNVRKIDDSGEWQSVGQFCGREIPPSINTTSQRVQLIFRTDNAVTADGFTVNILKTCNGVFNVTGKTQTVFSPVKWRTSFVRLVCNYTLVTDSQDYINLKFKKLDFGYRRQCSLSQLTIKKNNIHGELVGLGPYCESNSISSVKAKNYISVAYTGLVEINAYEFEFSLDACGGKVTRPQWIQSQQNEDGTDYVDHMNCVWDITAPANHNIIIKFKYLIMEPALNCSADYVEIYKGPLMQDEAREQRLCGNRTQSPPVFNIDGNRAIVAAVSDYLATAKGFLARIMFSKSCKERLTLTDANTPAQIDRQVEVGSEEVWYCDHRLMAPSGFRIQIELEEIDINSKNVTCQADCENCDYIEIVDSVKTGSLQLMKVCQSLENKQTVFTSFKDAIIRAHFEQPGSHKYNLTLRLLKSDCGSQTEFELKPDSPVHIASVVNSNKLYSPNVHCVWKIRSDTSFNIRFEKFSLQNVSDVTGECLDYMQVKAIHKFQLTLSSKHCGYVPSYVTNTFFDIESVEITFHTDEAIESTGFALTAMETLPCNLTYNSTSGSIRGHFESTCTNYIEMPENNNVNMFISNLYLSSENCSENYVRVYDMNTNKLIFNDCTPQTFGYGVFTSTNRVRVELKIASHAYLQLTYYAISNTLPPGCGGNLDMRSGLLVNPPYVKYENATVCRWNFTTTQPNKIEFDFNEIDMGTKCRSNYLDIIDIADNGDEKMARHFCSQDTHMNFVSMSNRVAIVTATTPEYDGTGWQVRFQLRTSSEAFGRVLPED